LATEVYTAPPSFLSSHRIIRSESPDGPDIYCLPMPKTQKHEEVEIKLRVPNIAAIQSQLKRLRAREIVPRTYESNTLYDTPRQNLRRCGRLIRIRIERPASNLEKMPPKEITTAILTYKGPSLSSRKASKAGGHAKFRTHFKIREEAEVSVTKPDEMARILGAFGLNPMFRYEKYRTTYALPGVPGLKIELDETPVGNYLELEGTTAGIDRGARLLEYDRKDYLKATYGSLYLADCRRKNRKPGHMLFPATKKLR
jgi:adenylate cyclase, class 2